MHQMNLTTVLMLVLIPLAADQNFAQQPVRIAPADDAAGCGYPTVDRLADGRLLCVFSTWPNTDRTPTVVAGALSDDHGRTWSEHVTLIDSHPHLDYDPNIVVMGHDVVVTSTTVPPTHRQFISTSRTLAVRSADDGRTWSPPYEIPMPNRYTAGKIHRGVMLGDGSALFGYAWSVELDHQDRVGGEGEQLMRIGLMFTHDRGQTWRHEAEITAHVEKDPTAVNAIAGLDEPAIVRCPDGSLYMLMRTGRDRLYESRSVDEGRTWSEPEPSPLVGHNAPAALCAFEGERPGILVVWNNSDRHRWPLSIAASFDDGQTWTPPRDIVHTEGFQASYPTCIQAADGEMVVIWQQDHPDRPRTIECARFIIDELADANDTN